MGSERVSIIRQNAPLVRACMTQGQNVLKSGTTNRNGRDTDAKCTIFL
jgi:hypothetical protein